jgi:chitodextrinase
MLQQASNLNPFESNDKIYKEKLNTYRNKQSLRNGGNKAKGSKIDSKEENMKPKGSQYLIKFKDDTPYEEIYKNISDHQYKVIGECKNRLFKIQIDSDQIAQLSGSVVEWTEKDSVKKINIVPNDPYISEQWAINKLSLPEAWNITTGSNAVNVAVIDSGVYREHPDLEGSCILNGWDMILDEPVNSDSCGHGTSVIGILAASTNNNRGISGIDWHVSVMPFRVVYPSGEIYTSDVVEAIYLAADSGCKVINLSLGGSDFSSAENQAVQYAVSKGSIVVAAAGNAGNSGLMYPASYENVISVASVDSNLTHSYFSNYNRYIDVCAPGENIMSLADYHYNNGYEYCYGSGTSLSVPYVSGIAALAAACDLSLTAPGFKNLIAKSCTDLGPTGFDDYYGCGLINAEKILENMVPPAAPTGLQVDSVSNSKMKVVWEANKESDLSGYQLEFKAESSNTWRIASSSLSKITTTYTKTGLVNGATYQFRLKAKDTSGKWSNYSEIASGVPIDNIAPQVPVGLKVISVNNGQVALGWSAVSAADLAGYQIEYKKSNEEIWSEIATGKVTSHIFTGLSNGEEYCFRLKARDTSGNLSNASATISAIPADKLAPAVPSGLKAASGSDKDVNLTWNANTENDLGGYEIAYLKYGTSIWVTEEVAAGEIGTTVAGLVQNVRYRFKIRAKDNSGNCSAYSTPVTATPKDLLAPAVPTDLSVQSKDRSLQLSWTANKEADLGGYQLEYKLVTVSAWSIANSSLSKTTTTYTKTGLVNGTTYQFRLKAKDTSGNWSAYSEIVSGIPAAI